MDLSIKSDGEDLSDDEPVVEPVVEPVDNFDYGPEAQLPWWHSDYELPPSPDRSLIDKLINKKLSASPSHAPTFTQIPSGDPFLDSRAPAFVHSGPLSSSLSGPLSNGQASAMAGSPDTSELAALRLENTDLQQKVFECEMRYYRLEGAFEQLKYVYVSFVSLKSTISLFQRSSRKALESGRRVH